MTTRWIPLTSLLLAVAGCAADSAPPLADRIKAGEGDGAIAYRDVSDAERRPAIELPAEAGVEDFVAAALRHNPRIAAARFEVERLAQRIPQETSLEDPMFEISPIGEGPQTAAGEVGIMLGVSQKLPFPGKLDTRGDIARRQVAIAAAALEQTRLEVEADVRRAYWSLYRAQQSLEIRSRTRQLLDQFHSSAQANFRAGIVSQQDVLRAAVELAELEREVAQLHQQRASAIAMLNSLMNRDADAPLPEIRPPEPAELELRAQQLLSAAWSASPAIRQANERIESARLEQKLARLQRWPDLTIGVGYNFVDDELNGMPTSGDDQWSITFGINLPIWQQRLRAAEREAALAQYGAIAQLAEARNDIAFRVHDAVARVQSQQQQIRLLRDRILPQARQAVESSASAYRAGRGSFVELIDNWQALLGFEQMYHDTLAELHQALADLQQVVAMPIASSTTQPTEQP